MTTPVTQRQDNDCGIAALAMMFGTKFSEMNAIVRSDFDRRRATFDGMTEKDFSRIITTMGDTMRQWCVGPKNRQAVIDRLQGRPAILIVPGRGYNPDEDAHALYWDGLRCYDPSPGGRYCPTGQTAFPALLRALVLDSDK